MLTNAIISPLAGENPCGENVRFGASTREIYFKIKDARNTARSLERGQNPTELVAVTQAWKEVNSLVLQLLSSHSKDIELVAWLMEAQLRLFGFAGLKDTYAATSQLLRDSGDALHSVDDEPEERFSPFAGLNGLGGEGTLIQPIRLTSLIPDTNFSQFSLWDFQLSQRAGEEERRDALLEAAENAGREAMIAQLREVNDCISAFDGFVAAVDAMAGAHAPSSSNIRNTLLEVAAAIRTVANLTEDELNDAAGEPPVAANENGQAVSASGATPHQAKANGEIQSREEAFNMLASVARYFRRHEPHSPIALSIETLVRRGRMDFAELLAELMPEMHVRNAVLTAAGIQPKPDDTD